jgi:hypothetical protein
MAKTVVVDAYVAYASRSSTAIKEEHKGTEYGWLAVDDPKNLTDTERQEKHKLEGFAKEKGLEVSLRHVVVRVSDRTIEERLDTKAKIRTSRMESRAQAKNPMFAEEEIKANLEKDPEYYSATRTFDIDLEATKERQTSDTVSLPVGQFVKAEYPVPEYIAQAMRSSEEQIEQWNHGRLERKHRNAAEGQEVFDSLSLGAVALAAAGIQADFKAGKGEQHITASLRQSDIAENVYLAPGPRIEDMPSTMIVKKMEDGIHLFRDKDNGQMYILPPANGTLQTIQVQSGLLDDTRLVVQTRDHAYEFACSKDGTVSWYKSVELELEKADKIDQEAGHLPFEGEPSAIHQGRQDVVIQAEPLSLENNEPVQMELGL